MKFQDIFHFSNKKEEKIAFSYFKKAYGVSSYSTVLKHQKLNGKPSQGFNSNLILYQNYYKEKFWEAIDELTESKAFRKKRIQQKILNYFQKWDTGVLFRSTENIINDLKIKDISIRTINRYLNELEKQGFIITSKNKMDRTDYQKQFSSNNQKTDLVFREIRRIYFRPSNSELIDSNILEYLSRKENYSLKKENGFWFIYTRAIDLCWIKNSKTQFKTKKDAYLNITRRIKKINQIKKKRNTAQQLNLVRTPSQYASFLTQSVNDDLVLK